jgi:5-formyltetrahydrofolate cyclo-ligase
MDKQTLREKYKSLRLGLSPSFVDDRSLEICRRLFEITDWTKVRTVCTYDPVARLREVDIKPLVDTLEYKCPNIKIKFLERTSRQPLPRTRFDIIIVPMLAFDKHNHRLGWGSGFYDRFLAKQPQAMKIGVCYRNSLVKHGIPAEPHDIPLDMIITEM